MPSYATLQDLIDRFGESELIELTDRSGGEAITVDQAVVGKALADAGEEIDGYLASRYRLPLDPVPGLVTRWACDLARASLYKDGATDGIKANAATARAALRDAQTGRLTLQANAVDSAVVSDTVELASAPRRFGPGNLRVF